MPIANGKWQMADGRWQMADGKLIFQSTYLVKY